MFHEHSDNSATSTTFADGINSDGNSGASSKMVCFIMVNLHVTMCLEIKFDQNGVPCFPSLSGNFLFDHAPF